MLVRSATLLGGDDQTTPLVSTQTVCCNTQAEASSDQTAIENKPPSIHGAAFMHEVIPARCTGWRQEQDAFGAVDLAAEVLSSTS